MRLRLHRIFRDTDEHGFPPVWSVWFRVLPCPKVLFALSFVNNPGWGIASLDPNERKAAEKLGTKTVELAYGALKKAWHPEKAPAFVIWNGSFGYDIDHGARINGMNIAIAGLIQQAGYDRWKGHDMQTRAYDNAAQGIDRVVRSVLSWEACEQAARELDTGALMRALTHRETAKAEDMMRHAVVSAQKAFDRMYA